MQKKEPLQKTKLQTNRKEIVPQWFQEMCVKYEDDTLVKAWKDMTPADGKIYYKRLKRLHIMRANIERKEMNLGKGKGGGGDAEEGVVEDEGAAKKRQSGIFIPVIKREKKRVYDWEEEDFS